MTSIHASTGLQLHTAPYALLFLRLALGAMWISHALLKVRSLLSRVRRLFSNLSACPGF